MLAGRHLDPVPLAQVLDSGLRSPFEAKEMNELLSAHLDLKVTNYNYLAAWWVVSVGWESIEENWRLGRAVPPRKFDSKPRASGTPATLL